MNGQRTVVHIYSGILLSHKKESIWVSWTEVNETRVCYTEWSKLEKKKYWRIDAFELWCWKRLLRVPWAAKRSNQSILKEISPEYSLEGLMLRLKLQYFGHLMRKTDSLNETMMLGKIEGGRKRGRQRMRWLDGITDSIDMIGASFGGWWWMVKPGVLQSMGSHRVRHKWETELIWTYI